MKTETNRYQKLTLEASQKSSIEEIQGKVEINSQTQASRNLPRASGDRMKGYFLKLHLLFQLLIDTVNAELQFKKTCDEVFEKEKSTDRLVRDLRNKVNALRTLLLPIIARINNTPYPVYLKHLVLAQIAVAVPASFDGLLAIPVFEIWGNSMVVAILMGVFFALALVILAHTFLKMIAKGRTIWQRRLIEFILFAFITGMFSYFADVRAEYLTNLLRANAADALNVHFSPIPFVLTSLLLFITAVAVYHFYMPGKEEKEAIRQYRALKKEKKGIEAQIKELEAKIESAQEEYQNLRSINASVVEYGCMLEMQIINKAESCYADWKDINLAHRPDNCKFDCYDDPYPFTFKTYFHSLNN